MKKKQPDIIDDYLYFNKYGAVKIKQYNKNNNLIAEYDSVSQTLKVLNMKRHRLYSYLNNKSEHPQFIFKKAKDNLMYVKINQSEMEI